MTKYTPSPGKTSLYTLPFHLTTLYYSSKPRSSKKVEVLIVESSFCSAYRSRILPKAPNFEAVPIPGVYWIDIFEILTPIADELKIVNVIAFET